MTQTLALLVDAYRELNARKMFWISLIISGVVMAAFALLGLNDKGLSLLGMDLPFPAAKFAYKYAFSVIVVFWWLSLGAMVLALISTASIFPDLLAGGSIDLYLAKPISRLRLFLTKFAGGLLFVLLQTAVFAVGSYLVFGLRAGIWRPSLFLIIPLGALLFSYLFSVSVLIGVMTRSTIAAILITVLFWALCIAGNFAERTLFTIKSTTTASASAMDKQVKQADAELAELKKKPSFTNSVFGFRERSIKRRRDEFQREADEARATSAKLVTPYRIVRGIATAIPKTGETIDLLDRSIFNDEDLTELREQMAEGGMFGNGGPNGRRGRHRAAAEVDSPGSPAHDSAPASTTTTTVATTSSSTRPSTNPSESAEDSEREREQRHAAMMETQEETERAARSRSVAWIIGTSVTFEAVVLSLAAWIFCRRDY